jgi:glycosyltransferase involved in cell wall biosynthesis
VTPSSSCHKILMVAYTHYESDPRVIREAQAAVDAGFEVDFLALRRADTPAVEVLRGVRVLRLNQDKYRGGGHFRYLMMYGMFFLRCFLKITLLFFKRRYRAVHVNNMPDFLVFTTLVPKMFGAKVILDIHDPMPNTFASKFNGREDGFFFRLLLWQERLSAAYSDRVITVHDPVKDGILVKHGLPADSIEVIANFPDSDVFKLRQDFSVEGGIRLAFHGTILERSGLRLLMNALANVRRKDRIRVKIVGEGDFSETLQDLMRSLNLGSMVDFDNRCYPVYAISERIAECNVGIVPLEISSVTNYALPLKLLEYMALGLPVMTVKSSAISYYFTDEDCIFFDANDSASLSRTLDRVAENPQMLLKYRERSIALRQRFSWAGEKVKYIAMLRELAGTNAATPTRISETHV